MQIINLTGKEQAHQSAAAYPSSFRFNTQNYTSGMYFMVLRHKGKIVGPVVCILWYCGIKEK
ncbi:MAG: hypothetical protein B7C24_17850 [Bacteroidetes bacterium 4572_77]|nr:MAG: hypothetical protein B7C24_17850 [Bacteroidetes bacterium 4572_77]